jgi:hypothetical protein
MAYYYFAATLPSFFWGDKPPLTVAEFIRQCEQYLSAQDVSTVTGVLGNGSGSHKNDVVERWAEFDRNFRNEMVHHRAKKYGLEADKYLRGERSTDMHVVALIQSASESDDPLTAEKAIDHAKWNLLDELVQGHFFDLDFLIVYGLKLQIVERYADIMTDRGKKTFDEIIGAVTDRRPESDDARE